MAAINLLSVGLLPKQFARVKVELSDLNLKVCKLKDEAAEKLNADKTTLDLVFCGNVLEDNECLSTYGIKPGVTIHVLKKLVIDEPVPPKKMTEADIQQIMLAFRTFKLSPNYRTALQRLSRPEVMKNIIAGTPGLAQDSVAIAILQDPELVVQLTDIAVLRKVVEMHPSLADAASHLAATLHEEAATVNPNTPGPSSGYSYSLEALSDDEMDSSSGEGQASGRNTITISQFAAALANASSQSTSTTYGNTNRIITAEMFTNAMQQAFANVNETIRPPTEPASEESIEQITRRLSPQLHQMRELGLTNIITNIQALQATGGDVQAAIDLVFNGVISPEM